MPLPAKRVDTVRVPNDTTTYDIVPSSLQDGSGKHSIATPTTTKDTTLVVGVKINNVTKEPTNGIVDLGTFQDGLDGDQLAAVNSGITADKVTKYEGYETKINSNTTEITTIKETLKSGVTFKGTVTGDELPPATDYNNGDLIIFGKKEYICFDKGTSKEWIELGDEGTHLTKTMADTYYVPYSGATEDVNLGEHSATVKNLVANGTTKLAGGIEPIKTYTFKTTSPIATVNYTLSIYAEGPWNPTSNFRPFFGTLGKRSGSKQEDSYIIGAYSVDTDTGTTLTCVHGNLFDGLTSTDPKNQDYTHIYCNVDSSGTATVTTEEYAFASDVNKKQDKAVDLTGITAKTVEGALTEIKGDIPNNIKDGTGANSIQENQDGTGGKFDFSGKNPNAFSFDATLNGQLDYGALGAFSSSFGGKGQARGKRGFQVGTNTIAYGNYTFASGSDSVAMGPASHVEGYNNTTGPTADSSHAEGGENLVTSNRGHVEGYKNTVKGMNGHGEGENVLVTENAEAGHAEGTNTKANNLSAHAEGQQTEANGINSHSENTLTRANGDSSHAEGYGNEVNSYAGHIEGSGNKILNTLPSSGGGDTPGPSPTDPDDPTFNINEHLGYNSHVEGSLNISYGYNSHTEGTKNTTFGHYAHTEGSGNKNYGTNNHMEGSQNKMSDTAAVAITDSHIEGTNNNVTNPCSNLHMGGVSNTGGADGAYVMGHNNDVSSTAKYSATFGKGLKTTDEDTIVLGTYNKVQQGTGRMLVIGNGTSDTARKNAVEIMRDGRVKLSKAPEENDDVVRLLELHSKQDVIYGAQADALNSTINKTKVNKYEGYEAKINSNTSEIAAIKGTISDLPSVDNNFSTTSTNPVQNRVITEAFNELQGQVNNNEQDIGYINQFFENSNWKFLGKVAEKSFQKMFTEVKPNSSGIPTGYATVSVVVTTYANTFSDGGYKTVMDIICRCPQFNLNDVGFKVLLSTVGSRWFVPRMAIGKGDMQLSAFNVMMDKLNAQKDAVGISVDEVAVFKDNRGVSGNPGSLNVSGVTNGQVVYDAAEFRVFAVMLELDKDNEGKAIPCTGAHYKINIFHPYTIL